jgi:hypothetical protein
MTPTKTDFVLLNDRRAEFLLLNEMHPTERSGKRNSDGGHPSTLLFWLLRQRATRQAPVT